MSIEKRFIALIAGISKIPQEEFSGDTKITNSGILSSLGMLDLMVGIEEEFSIEILPEEFIEDNFYDVNSICKFIESKME